MISSKAEHPSLTVLMPVYNGADYLSGSVESILGQSYGDFRFVIIDDGSEDDTPAVLADYEARDGRVRVIRNDRNLGLTRSLNKGLSLTEGEWIARMDCDDISLPGRFEAQVAFFERHPEAAMVGVAWKEMSADLERTIRVMRPPTEYDRIRRRILAHNVLCHSAVMMRRAPVMASGGYNQRDVYSQDYDLWLRVVARYPVANLREVHQLRRIHPGNLSHRNIRNQLRTMARAQRRYIRETGISPVYNVYVFWRLLLSRLPVGFLALLGRLNQTRSPF